MFLFGKKRKIEEKIQKTAEQKKVEEKISEVEEISPNQYKNIVHSSYESEYRHSHHHSSSHQHHHHHHHRHSNNEAAKKNRDLLTDFSADEIKDRTDEYTGSHRIDRAVPKHPHPHDKIAHDSRYSAEELDKLNADRISDFSTMDIEGFKKSFDENLSKSHRHRYKTVNSTIEQKSDGIPENFDADKFLSDFQKNGTGHSHSHHSHHLHHLHHLHHSHREEHELDSTYAANSFYDENRDKKQEQLDKIRAEMSE